MKALNSGSGILFLPARHDILSTPSVTSAPAALRTVPAPSTLQLSPPLSLHAKAVSIIFRNSDGGNSCSPDNAVPLRTPPRPLIPRLAKAPAFWSGLPDAREPAHIAGSIIVLRIAGNGSALIQ